MTGRTPPLPEGRRGARPEEKPFAPEGSAARLSQPLLLKVPSQASYKASTDKMGEQGPSANKSPITGPPQNDRRGQITEKVLNGLRDVVGDSHTIQYQNTDLYWNKTYISKCKCKELVWSSGLMFISFVHYLICLFVLWPLLHALAFFCRYFFLLIWYTGTRYHHVKTTWWRQAVASHSSKRWQVDVVHSSMSFDNPLRTGEGQAQVAAGWYQPVGRDMGPWSPSDQPANCVASKSYCSSFDIFTIKWQPLVLD